MIAALYVAERGPYVGLQGVDAWPLSRDATRYAGPWPVVAHPPCARWCLLAGLVESRHPHLARGEDGGTFAAALAAVRAWGGVLEHPAYSGAWAAHGLAAPTTHGGWVAADLHGGWTCCVEQGRYGHRARKRTWLYVAGVRDLPELRWGATSAAEARAVVGYAQNRSPRTLVERMSKRESSATPPEFRDLLISIARSARTNSSPEDLNTDHYRTPPPLLALAQRCFAVRALAADVAARRIDAVVPTLGGCATDPGAGSRTGAASALETPWARAFDLRANACVDLEAGSVVWCNPPYSNASAWIERAREEHESSGLRVLALVPVRPDTRAWQDHIHDRARVRWVPARVAFDLPAEWVGPPPPGHGSGRNSVAVIGWGWGPGYGYLDDRTARGGHWQIKREQKATAAAAEGKPGKRTR